MKLQIASDIHVEFHADNGKEWARMLPNENCDVLIIAGDLATKSTWGHVLPILTDRFPNVIYVPGNHEYWGHSFSVVNEELKLFAEVTNNFHFLLNDSVVIESQRFVGSTLWFAETPETFRKRFNWSDFQRIVDGAHEIYALNESCQRFLRETVSVNDVVVTHHLPTRQSISKNFENSENNDFFICPMDDLLNERKPKLWVHGHTHDSFDYIHQNSGTRIVCNPFGYVGVVLNLDYVEPKIVEV